MIVKEGELYDSLLGLPNYINTVNYDRYYVMLKKICKYSETAYKPDEIMLHSLILELLYNLIKEAKKAEYKKNNSNATVEKVMNYIKENLTEDLSLEKVSAFAGFSSVYFHNYFKSATGRTLHQYIEEQRIKKAANMLITTDLTLAAVAYECGFSSQSYFSFAFKRKMNLTPREYTKKVNERYDGHKKSGCIYLM